MPCFLSSFPNERRSLPAIRTATETLPCAAASV